MSPQKIKSESRSVVYDSLQPHGLYSPCSSPGQNSEPFTSPGDLPNPGIEPMFPTLQAILYQLSHQGSPKSVLIPRHCHPVTLPGQTDFAEVIKSWISMWWNDPGLSGQPNVITWVGLRVSQSPEGKKVRRLEAGSTARKHRQPLGTGEKGKKRDSPLASQKKHSRAEPF